MKKVLFYPALLALILANVIVYSCQKENPMTTLPAVEELATVDRAAPCSPITITGGIGFGICNIDNGPWFCSTPCTGTQTNVPFDIITASPQNFAFLNNNTFSLMNPNPGPINVTISFPGGCAGQVFLIPGNGQRSFQVAVNPATGCCTAVVIC